METPLTKPEVAPLPEGKPPNQPNQEGKKRRNRRKNNKQKGAK
jgi:hypothetical protein